MSGEAEADGALVGDGAVARLLAAPAFAAAGLGDIETWSPALCRALQLMLDTGPPAALLWGAERALFYNDAAAALLAGRHPVALGRPLAAVWRGMPEAVSSLVDGAFVGRPAAVGAVQLAAFRTHEPVDLSFAVTVTPLRDDDGAFAGLLATGVETSASPAAVPDPAQDVSSGSPRLTVLVVEDDPLVLDAVGDLLAAAGHHVVSAASSEEAVATLAAHQVDVLLTDLNLPGASGATLAATALRLRSEVGIVLATGDMGGAAHVAVPHRLLAKPFTAAELASALSDFRPLPPPEPTVWIAD